MSTPIVGFAGMTHLGLVSASAVAMNGFQVICYDADPKLIGRLAKRDLPVSEPGLDQLVRENGERQVFTADLAAISRCDVVYIAPDVPTDDFGQSDLAPIRQLIAAIVRALASHAVLVVLCQVPPGFTRSLAAPPPERRYYQVETLVFGQAVERARRPERYIVGCDDPGKPLDGRLRAVLEPFGCPILPMRYESAELAKISINMCLVASIGVANMLAELCEHIGAVWSEITPALKLDRRIGAYSYLAPGTRHRRRQSRTRSRDRRAPRVRASAATRGSSVPGSPTVGIAAIGPRAPFALRCSTTSRTRPSPCGASPTRKIPIR